jgi:hypothetical protein
LGIPLAIQEMNAYRIHHVARLLLNREGGKIMKEYVNLEGSRIPQYSTLSYLLSQSLDDAQLSWNDWNRFKANPDQYIIEPLFEMNENSKKKDDWQFSFKDKVANMCTEAGLNTFIHQL